MGLVGKGFRFFDRRSCSTSPTPSAGFSRERRAQRRHCASGSATLFWFSESGELRNAMVDLQNVTTEGVAIAVPELIAVGETVRLRSERFESRASVRYCRRHGLEFLAGLRLMQRERRREERLSASGLAHLDWTDASGRHMTTIVKAKNVSGGGMQVQIPNDVDLRQVKLDEMVRIWGKTYEGLGWIRCCEQPDGGHYVLGIQLVRPAYRKDCLEYRD